MTFDKARYWLVLTSFVTTGVVFIFFVVAPSTGFPLSFGQARGLLEIIVPVFVGYLASAAHYTFSRNMAKKRASNGVSDKLTSIMIRGPIVVFIVACFVAIVTFGYSNRPSAPSGNGMSIESLAWVISGGLGLLSVTTNVAVTYLFSIQENIEQ